MIEVSSQTYTLKMIRNYYNQGKQELENRYTNEWQILARLESHPNVIKPIARFVNSPTKQMLADVDPFVRSCLEAGQTQFFLFEFHPIDLVMKLKYLSSAKELGWNTIAHYSLEVCKTLEFLQKKNVLHNDLKLENILVSFSDSLIFSDFGVSMVTENNWAPRKQLKDGNRAHKAPEIHNKLKVKQEKLINVEKQYSWEAGCLLFEIAFGVAPFNLADIFYPLSCEVATTDSKYQVQVPQLTFPSDVVIEGEDFEDFTGLLSLLLCNDPDERVTISDAVVILHLLQSQ